MNITVIVKEPHHPKGHESHNYWVLVVMAGLISCGVTMLIGFGIDW